MPRGEPTQSQIEARTREEIERLYGLPLSEFTAARNALATRLRKEGQAAASDLVKGLTKPTPSAWAVNALLRTERAAFAALLAAGERSRAAQAAVAAGRASPEEMRQALAEQRERRDELKRRGARLLTEAGLGAGAVHLERLSDDLDALSLDPAAKTVRERGWLDADLDPPGFEVLAGLQLAAGPDRGLRLVRGAAQEAEGKATPESLRAAPGRQIGEREAPRELPAVRKPGEAAPARPSREEEARRRWEEAARRGREKEEERRREQVARATEKRARAREELQREEAAVESAERAVRDAEKAADEARRRATQARERAAQAAERLARAERELALARGED